MKVKKMKTKHLDLQLSSYSRQTKKTTQFLTWKWKEYVNNSHSIRGKKKTPEDRVRKHRKSTTEQV